MAQAAGLTSLLEDRTAQNTIFAPTDQAFTQLEAQLGLSNSSLLANTQLDDLVSLLAPLSC